MIDYYEEGFDAFACGIPWESCPYDGFTIECLEWCEGWIEASYK